MLRLLKPYVVLLTMVLLKRKMYIKLTILIIIIKKFLYELGGSKLEDPFLSVQELAKKIKDFYGNRIKIQKAKVKKENIIFSSSLDFEEALLQEICLNDVQVKVREIAFLLRGSIMNVKTIPLIEHLKHLKHLSILQGEVEVPENLRQFLHYQIYGPNKIKADNHHERTQQRIKSIYKDIVFAASSGKKISKQLILRLTMKSLTGYRRVMEILN